MAQALPNPDSERFPGLNRRTFILAAGAAIALSAIESPGVAARAETLPSEVSRVTLTSGAIKADSFSADWSLRRTTVFPRSWAPPWPRRGSVLELTWDPRLFLVDPVVLLEKNRELVAGEMRLSADGRAAVDVPVGVQRVHFMAVAQTLYPNENFDEVADTRLTVRAGSLSAVDVFTSTMTAVTAWGAELTATWVESEGYLTPSSLRLLSVGPNPVPSGVEAVCVVPSAVSTEANRAAPQTVDHALGLAPAGRKLDRFRLVAPLPPGETAVLIEQVTHATGRTPDLTRVGSIELKVPPSQRPGMRAGLLATYPVTPSGTLLSDYTTSSSN